MATLINNYNHHTITKDGVVTNQKTQNVKSIWKAKSGYYCVDISENGKSTKHYLHRLLAETFLPNPEDKRTVNHIDGDKTNNHLANLEWATDSENIQHAYNNSLNYSSTKKVSDSMLQQILDRFLGGESFADIIKDYDVSATTISTYIQDYAKDRNLFEEYQQQRAIQYGLRAKASKRVRYTVKQLDIISDQVLNEFGSLKEASRHLGKTSSGPISNVLAGRAQTAYGFKWVRG